MIYAITSILLAIAAGPKWPVIPGIGLDAGVSCDPRLTVLFAPRRPHVGRYEVCTTPESPDALVGEGFTFARAEQLEALDIFGTAGAYDRAALAQLYAGRRARVVRGWRLSESVFESVTLISPYPDASLERLNPGTMIVSFRLERGAR